MLLEKIKKLHFHNYEVLLMKRCDVQKSYFGRSAGMVIGVRALERCSVCGKTRAWLLDDEGNGTEKLPECLFTDDELKISIREGG